MVVTCTNLKVSKVPKNWLYPFCQQTSAKQQKSNGLDDAMQAALQLDSICVCKKKASESDRLIECHKASCINSKFFHFACLHYKQKPNNAKTTWLCPVCALSAQLVLVPLGLAMIKSIYVTAGYITMFIEKEVEEQVINQVGTNNYCGL